MFCLSSQSWLFYLDWFKDEEFFKRARESENMKITKNIGFLLLGIWLIVTGLLQVMEIPIPEIGMLLSILAIAAGTMLVLNK